MVWFDILDCPVFLPGMLLADTSITAFSYVVASVAKTFNWS
jgi:hypothetical protein